MTDFYPRSPCGERPDMAVSYSKGIKISIHALLAESDRLPTALRTPHHKFLSTLSLRRATNARPETRRSYAISIHALLAESDQHESAGDTYQNKFLSTLSLRRATSRAKTIPAEVSHFYPRSPCGERHCTGVLQLTFTPISIHALLAESDR